MNEDLKPIEHPDINDSGMLDVGDGHSLYWVDWGNPNAKHVIFYLHGGPGSGIDAKDFDKFDAQQHRVIFHDQRGSGRSTPFASIENNTTDDLVEDINRLRKHLGIDTISIYGHSWGSTLALVYAIRNPEKVEKMLIGGIFLGRKVDEKFYLGGGIASHFPEVWDEFRSLVPASEQANIGKYYKSKLFGEDEEERRTFARAWMKYESSIVALDYRPKSIERQLNDFASESLAYLEAHYILNGCFVPENYILSNADTLRDIPTVIVHGRYDFICMPSAALELKQALGNNAHLHMVAGGHASGETTMREVYSAYRSLLWK